MFTGIIEDSGKVVSVKKEKGNAVFTIESSFTDELKKGQSVAHNGVCLTVETINPLLISPLVRGRARRAGGLYTVTAIKETLSKTNLGKLKAGDEVNLERSLKVGDRLDGHFVQGHVDCTALVRSIRKEKGSWLFEFQVKSKKLKVKSLLIDKGSVCVNGVSLTVVQVSPNGGDLEGAIFSVAIIPHTFKHTNFSSLKKGSIVNIEFDILGKHIHKILSHK